MSNELTVSQYLNQDVVSESIRQTLGAKAPQFVASVSSIASNNKQLAIADKKSLMSACLIAASLDLPINPNLGFAYIIPYEDRKAKITYAQFQMGWKGFVQLAMRSGQYKTINVTEVREGELVGKDQLSGEMEFSFIEDETEREKVPVIGYVAYFKLLTGFQKMNYMSVTKLEAHGKKYSQSFKKGYGNWVDDFDGMARKTVLKLLLSKFGVMTVELEKAIVSDQVVVEENTSSYADNKPADPEKVAYDKEHARILKHIQNAKTEDDLSHVLNHVGEYDLVEEFESKQRELQDAK